MHHFLYSEDSPEAQQYLMQPYDQKHHFLYNEALPENLSYQVFHNMQMNFLQLLLYCQAA